MREIDFTKRILATEVSAYLNKNILLCGWIKKIRKLGSLVFIDLRDRSGIVQLVVDATLGDFVENKTHLTKESTIMIEGIVLKRKSVNPQLVTGEYEIKVEHIHLFSTADVLPMLIEDETDALENVRLKHRYLDLRRSCMQAMLTKRACFFQAIREFLVHEKFVEIETPYLTKPTPEGARDYIVPTRLGVNRFYALSQSPQLYKQLLMISGVERYFQFARCFRDEDARSDRQPEHTQLDFEMAFVNAIDVQNCIERMVKSVMKKVFDVEVEIPFPRIDYADALNKYGSDKPDLRFKLQINEATEYFASVYKKLFNIDHAVVKVLCLPDAKVDHAFMKTAQKCAKDNHGVLHWISYKNQQIIDASMSGLKHETDVLKCLRVDQDAAQSNAGIIFIVGSQKNDIVNKSLGSVRNAIYNHYCDQLPIFQNTKNQWYFCWVVNWPLFEPEEVIDEQLSTPTKTIYRERIASAHNPFTKPQTQTLQYLETDPYKVMADSYDLVLNGNELGSGAIRNSNPEMQASIFKVLGLDPNDIKRRFGFLLEAYKFGAPPHGGIGIGLERWLAIMLHLTSIKDVIAFPKTNQGLDLMMNSPDEIEQALLKDVFIDLHKNND